MAAHLLHLPQELLSAVITEAIHHVGIRKSVKLRSVCTTFNKLVLDSIYALPTFEHVDYKGPAHLSWDPRMNTAVADGLIRARMHHSDRALVRSITTTADCLSEYQVDLEREACIDNLIRLAAISSPVSELIRGLSKRSSYNHTARCASCRNAATLDMPQAGLQAQENALCLLLFLNRAAQAANLLYSTTLRLRRTKWFGDPLVAAACYSDSRTFVLVMQGAFNVTETWERNLVISRLAAALERAAYTGRTDLFSVQVWRQLWQHIDDTALEDLFASALKSAALAQHEETLCTILRTLDTPTLSSKDYPHAFWIELLRVVASDGCMQATKAILCKLAPGANSDLSLVVEDACRNGHVEIVQLLTTHSIPSDLGIAAWWAGRSMNQELLLLLAQKSEGSVVPICDALSGSSIHEAPGMMTTLQLMAPELDLQSWCDKDITFADLMDWVLQTSNSHDPVSTEVCSSTRSASQHSRDMFSPHARELFDACSRQDLVEVQRLIATPLKGSTENLAGAFSYSIIQQRPSLVQYLYEKLPENRYFTTDSMRDIRSTSMFQLLLDRGWSINAGAVRLHSAILGSMLASDELTRWFLEQGADPNTRCDWDITPLSLAVRSATLSTIELLLRYGGDSRRGQLLYFAMQRTSLDTLAVVDMLLARGACIDARSFEDDPASWVEKKFSGMGPALYSAVEEQNRNVVEYLINYGASHDVLDTAGRTAIDLARKTGDSTILDLLENAKAR